MKRTFTVFTLLFMLGVLSIPIAAESPAFRVMSFNILNDDTRASRFAAIEQTVLEVDADIFGLQEARETFNTVKTFIKQNGYASAVDTLVDDPNNSGIVNCVPIYYKTDRFSLVEGSAGARRFTEKYGDSWTKSMTYCVLTERASGASFIVFNMHFAVLTSSMTVEAGTSGAEWRISNAKELLEQIAAMRAQYGDLPIIALGDFNMTEVTKAYRMLLPVLTDCAHVAVESEPYKITYHGGTSVQSGGYPIDHVFVTGDDFSVRTCAVWKTENGAKASDHFPLYADLTLTENAHSAIACADMHPAKTPLMILDATRRTPYADVMEGFTVMNVSDQPIDLSHVLVWYGTAANETALGQLDPEKVTTQMRLCGKRNTTYLAPGEKAYIWCVFSGGYKTAVQVSGGTAVLVTEGADGKPQYQEKDFRDATQNFAASYPSTKIEEKTKLIPLDRTTQDAFGEAGSYKNLASSFNLQNSVYIRLYLTYDTAESASEAFCVADLDGCGGGTYLKSTGTVAVKYGTFLYEPSDSVQMKTAAFVENVYPFGNLTAEREALFSAVSERDAHTVVALTLDSTAMNVNGEVRLMDAPPIIRNDRMMLPIRFVAEAFGATVDWDGATSTVTVTGRDGSVISITIGSLTSTVNGKSMPLDSAAFIDPKTNRTYLPVRAVAEALGATVDWDSATSTATLQKEKR